MNQRNYRYHVVAGRVRCVETPPGRDYARYLIAEAGNRMRRALIQARHRYERLQPARIRTNYLHTLYRRRQ